MRLDELKKCKYGLTHAGTFHADDVFAVAFIKIINPNIKILRKSEVPSDFKGIVFDIGDGEFDHHGGDKMVRRNGIPYASFGKLWRAFAKKLYGEYVYKKIDKKLIEHLDLSDNTGIDDSLCTAIAAFNPNDDGNGDKEFNEALVFAKEILERMIENEQKNYEEEIMVKEIYDKSLNKEIIVLDKYLHFKDTLPGTKAKYVIYPSKRGGYLAQGVTVSSDTIELKKPFPEKWIHMLPSYLTFCHSSRFLIGGKSIEDLKMACEYALKEDNDDR